MYRLTDYGGKFVQHSLVLVYRMNTNTFPFIAKAQLPRYQIRHFVQTKQNGELVSSNQNAQHRFVFHATGMSMDNDLSG